MKALIHEMLVYYDLWKEDHKQVKQSGSENSVLQQEVYNLLGSNEGKLSYYLIGISCCSGPNLSLFSSGLRKHIDILEGEKTIWKQQAEELQQKLDAAKERRIPVEEKLIEGSIIVV